MQVLKYIVIITVLFAGLTREEIEAQAFLFFLAGYDTTASTLAFFLYNMALNPQCQERLRDELDEAFGNNVCLNVVFNTLCL